MELDGSATQGGTGIPPADTPDGMSVPPVDTITRRNVVPAVRQTPAGAPEPRQEPHLTTAISLDDRIAQSPQYTWLLYRNSIEDKYL